MLLGHISTYSCVAYSFSRLWLCCLYLRSHSSQRLSPYRNTCLEAGSSESIPTYTWFDIWSWIHYDESSDSAFCHICAKAEGEGKLKTSSKDLLFIQKGFTKWKDATEGFCQHEQIPDHSSKCTYTAAVHRTLRKSVSLRNLYQYV